MAKATSNITTFFYRHIWKYKNLILTNTANISFFFKLGTSNFTSAKPPKIWIKTGFIFIKNWNLSRRDVISRQHKFTEKYNGWSSYRGNSILKRVSERFQLRRTTKNLNQDRFYPERKEQIQTKFNLKCVEISMSLWQRKKLPKLVWRY